MRRSVLGHVAWLLTTVVAFAAGMSFTGSPEPRPALSQDAPKRLVRFEGSKQVPTEGYLESGIISSTPGQRLGADEARARTFEVLSEPNRLKRMQLVCGLLGGITKENYDAVLRAFVLQTIHDGRTHDQEWLLVLERVGEVAGAEAVTKTLKFKDQANQDRARRYLIGWAGAEPQQALEWLRSQPPELQAQLLPPLINGMARANPKQALELAMKQPLPLQEATLGSVVEGAIQRGGYAEAEGLLKPLIGRTDIEDGTRGKLFYEISHRKVNSARLNQDPFEALDWLDGYLGDGSPAGAAATQELIGSTASVDANATLKWLEDRTDRFGPYKSAAAYPVVARALQAQNPEKFAAWMDSNPDHPQHDVMAAAAVGPLVKAGKLEDAQRLCATIRDERLRNQTAQAFQARSR